MLELKIYGWDYVEKPKEWQEYPSKSYIAHIIDTHTTFHFDREFLKLVKVDNNTYFKLSDFQIGEIYDIRCINDKKEPLLSGFFKLNSISDGRLIFEEISDEDIHKAIIEKRYK